MTDYEATTPAVVGFMDIGTNSIRLLVVRIAPNHSFTVVHQLKETVRLGDHEFVNNRLRRDAVERSVAIVKQFASTARAAGADEIVAVATAATREAENRRYFLERLSDEAGLDVRVVSGMEEARLAYLGVTSGVHLEGRRAFCVDIGGGSTEVSVGTQEQHLYLNSLKLGAIRLTNRFLGDSDGPVSPRYYERIRRYVRNDAARTLRELRQQSFDLTIGSSGTIENLTLLASRLEGRPPYGERTLSYDSLRHVVARLCELPLDERRRMPGMNPARADIIIGGAAILDTLMDELSIDELQVSERGLRDGLLVDYLNRHGYDQLVRGASVRERSVLQLGRRCGFNESHAETTAVLALSLFDSARQAGLHQLGPAERELLRYAALLHHIGAFLTYNGYQKHSEYLIRNAELLGFDETEVAVIGLTALYHRNDLPRKKDTALGRLPQRVQDAIGVMSCLLRIAENLDRSQAGVVEEARLEKLDDERALLRVRARQGWQVELWGVENQMKAFQKTFGQRLVVEAVPAAITIA